MKKHFLILIAILCMLLVFTGCGKASSQVDPEAIAVIAAGREKISVYTELSKTETGEFLVSFHERLDEVKDQIPVVTWQEGMVMEFSDGYECWGIGAYDLSGNHIASHLGTGDLSELSALNGGEYYFDAYVVEEHEDDATDYKGYSCVFQMKLPDLDPFVTVTSNGEETVAPKYWYCGMFWEEDEDGSGGWLLGDGSGIYDDMEGIFPKLPEVRMAEDFSIRYGEDINAQDYFRVFDEDLQDHARMDTPEELKTLGSGTYYVVTHVFRDDTEVHEGETGYNGYHCGFKLTVPGAVTVVSDGKEIFPIINCYESENWDEEMDGWVSESSSWIEEEVRRKAPEALSTEDITVKLAENVRFDRIILVDMESGETSYTTDPEALKDFAGGSYFAEMHVTKYGEEYDGKREYWKYSCTFKMTVSDENPVVSVCSNGNRIVPAEYWFCGREWMEDGWMYSDGMSLFYRLEEVCGEFPEVQLSTDISVNYAENTTPREIRVYNEKFQLIGETMNWEKLKTLESGSYYVVLEVFKNGTEMHEGETDYDGYEYGIRLIVPEGYTPVEVWDKNKEPLVTAVTAKGAIPLYEHNTGGLVWIEEIQQGVYEDSWTLQEAMEHDEEIVLPEISLEDLNDLEFSDEAVLSYIAVYDAELDQEVAGYGDEVLFFESDHPELERGEDYILRVFVMKYGFRIINEEREHSIYECVCRLTVPE